MNFKIKYIYLFFIFLGLLLPYIQMYKYTLEYGFNYSPLFTDIFKQSSTAFFAYDLLITALVCMFFMIYEAKKIKMKNVWIPVACSLLIGLAFGLPLFMYYRENHLEKTKNKQFKKSKIT
jgi:hypothetical protein